MKKVILGIALLSQFSYGVEGVPEFTEISKKANQSLVPLNFFDISKVNFRKQLKKSEQSVASEFRRLNALPELDEEERENRKLLTVIDEFEALNIFCKDEFDKNRDKANEAFLHVLATRTKNIMQDEIALKEAEIIRLQGRLDELLKGAPQTAESLSSFDKIIQRAEEDIRTTKEETENFDVSEYELIKKKQITRTFERFNEKLNDIQNEVQNGKDDLEKTLREVFEKTQKQYEDNTNNLLENLEYRYDDIITEVEKSYRDQKKNLAKAYDRQIAIMNDKINEFTALNAQLEKEKELQSLISGVFVANPSLKPEKIMIRSTGISRMTDIFGKRATVQAEYSKFAPFSSLLGREDLGVTATVNDLSAVRRYVDETVIAPFTAVPPRGRPHLVNVDHGWGNRGGDTEWNNGRRGGANHDAWVNPVLVGWLNEMGEYNFTVRWWNKYAPTWPGEQLWAAIGRATSTYNSRLAAYQTQKSQYEARIRHAQAVAFPSDAFDRLIDQFNIFVNKL